jgi:hypothetical protein
LKLDLRVYTGILPDSVILKKFMNSLCSLALLDDRYKPEKREWKIQHITAHVMVPNGIDLTFYILSFYIAKIIS